MGRCSHPTECADAVLARNDCISEPPPPLSMRRLPESFLRRAPRRGQKKSASPPAMCDRRRPGSRTDPPCPTSARPANNSGCSARFLQLPTRRRWPTSRTPPPWSPGAVGCSCRKSQQIKRKHLTASSAASPRQNRQRAGPRTRRNRLTPRARVARNLLQVQRRRLDAQTWRNRAAAWPDRKRSKPKRGRRDGGQTERSSGTSTPVSREPSRLRIAMLRPRQRSTPLALRGNGLSKRSGLKTTRGVPSMILGIPCRSPSWHFDPGSLQTISGAPAPTP